MSKAVAGVGTVVLAAGIGLSAQSGKEEAGRQSSGRVLPYEVQVVPAALAAGPEQAEARQGLRQQLESQNVDVPTAPAADVEVTCALRILKPDRDVDPGIYVQVPRTNVESKIRVLSSSPCRDLIRTAVPARQYQVETVRSGRKSTELPQTSIKR